jgi:hypothetical protein
MSDGSRISWCTLVVVRVSRYSAPSAPGLRTKSKPHEGTGGEFLREYRLNWGCARRRDTEQLRSTEVCYQRTPPRAFQQARRGAMGALRVADISVGHRRMSCALQGLNGANKSGGVHLDTPVRPNRVTAHPVSGEIGDEQQPELGRREVVRRSGKMKLT